ncbi:MAG TPA: hypothetical protein VMV53_09125 [Acidimicrobiales bacterium]|nr:hypothetical protein [Acidimicrobiales bacterium]
MKVTAPPKIRYVAGDPTGSLVSLVFSTVSDGMALEQLTTGSDALYVTHNGAHSWTRWPLPAGAQLMDLVAAPTGFFATERTCQAKPWRCVDTSLLRAEQGATRWSATPIPGARSLHGEIVDVGAWRHHVWLTGSTPAPPYAFLATSTDGGRSFSMGHEGDLMSIVSCSLIAMSERSLWATCLGGHAYTLLHSSDAGSQWQTVSTPVPNMAQGSGFAPVSATTSYVSLALTKRLYVITRGGKAVTLRGPSPSPYLVGLVFVGAKDGLAIGQKGSAFRVTVTSDGGRHWTRIQS